MAFAAAAWCGAVVEANIKKQKKELHNLVKNILECLGSPSVFSDVVIYLFV